ncbi:hypothetical protein ES702_05407 [subsurface metagenome]
MINHMLDLVFPSDERHQMLDQFMYAIPSSEHCELLWMLMRNEYIMDLSLPKMLCVSL